MSLLTDLLHPFSKVESAVEAIVPESLIQKYGSYAHALAANFLHDVATGVKAGIVVAAPMSKTVLATIMAAVEQEASTLAPEVLSGKVKFADALTTAVESLKSPGAASILPALEQIGKTTLTTALSVAMSAAIASVSGSPTSSPAKS